MYLNYCTIIANVKLPIKKCSTMDKMEKETFLYLWEWGITLCIGESTKIGESAAVYLLSDKCTEVSKIVN